MDLHSVRIVGADLSGGLFDKTNLCGADLRKVRLYQAWLRNANLKEAKLGEVKFGEIASLNPLRPGELCIESIAVSSRGVLAVSIHGAPPDGAASVQVWDLG